jgi:O-antigen/teichoic acid export membrane protein
MIRRVLAGVGANFFDKLIVAGTQLAMVPALSQAWGLHLYGLWLLLATVPSFLAVGDFGFGTAAGTKMIMARARGEESEVVHVFQSAWGAILMSSAALAALALALAWTVPAEIFGEAPGLPIEQIRVTLTLLMLYGIAAVQGSIFFAAFRAAGMFAFGATWNALIILIESSVVITAALGGAEPPLVAAALLGGRLVGLAGQTVLLRRRVPWLRIGLREGTRAEMLALLRPAGAVMLVPLAQALALQGTAVALGIAAGQAAVPVFTATRTLSRVGLQICWLFNTPLMPEFSSAAAREDRHAMALMTLVTVLVSTLLLVPYALLFAAFGQEAILLWTHEVILPPAPVVTTMALVILLGGYWYPLSNLILARNLHSSYTRWYVLLAALSLPLAVALSRQFGATGAAVAMALLEGAMLFVILRLAGRLLATPREITAAMPDLVVFLRKCADRLRRAVWRT